MRTFEAACESEKSEPQPSENGKRISRTVTKSMAWSSSLSNVKLKFIPTATEATNAPVCVVNCKSNSIPGVIWRIVYRSKPDDQATVGGNGGRGSVLRCHTGFLNEGGVVLPEQTYRRGRERLINLDQDAVTLAKRESGKASHQVPYQILPIYMYRPNGPIVGSAAVAARAARPRPRPLSYSTIA